MKLSKRIKWIAAVSILALGIPTAGFALNAPCVYTNTQLPSAASQQGSQTPVNTINLDRQQAQTTTTAPQVKPAAVNNVSAPICNYNNYCKNQCVQTSAPAAQVKAPASSTMCPNYYNNNCRNTGSGGTMTGNYGHGAGHGRGGC